MSIGQWSQLLSKSSGEFMMVVDHGLDCDRRDRPFTSITLIKEAPQNRSNGNQCDRGSDAWSGNSDQSNCRQATSMLRALLSWG
jgi:hypothetical protein